MANDAELVALLKEAPLHWIGGREPNVDWFGERPKDKRRTICVRLTLSDRDRLVSALTYRAKHKIKAKEPRHGE